MQYSKELEKEYNELFSSCEIKTNKIESVKQYTSKIVRFRSRYENVSTETGVPWHVIAVIHAMESSVDFNTHLHNGDPLTARTVQVPRGRPKTHKPPFTWEESAVDALNYDGAAKLKNWDIPHTLFFLEGYNGWGYRIGIGVYTTPPKRSPYLWSYTNHYEKGKYVQDGKFSRETISNQAGCCAIIKTLEKMGAIKLNNLPVS